MNIAYDAWPNPLTSSMADAAHRQGRAPDGSPGLDAHLPARLDMPAIVVAKSSQQMISGSVVPCGGERSLQ
jgi:hypothetical protein